MSFRQDLVGKKFGRLTVLSFHHKNKWNAPYWNCICNCGMERIVAGHHLKCGKTISCGCYNSERMTKRKKTTAKFIEEATDLHKGKYDYSKTEYIGSDKKLIIICRVHGEFPQTAADHLGQKGFGCPKCGDMRLTNEYIDNFIQKYSLSVKRIDNYINNKIKIKWQCLKCDYIWPSTSHDIMRDAENRDNNGCPQCARGRNEKRVAETLNELNIYHERLRIDLPTGQKLFPDFHLPELNIIIEYNGVQHYRPTCFGSMSQIDAEVSFTKQQIRDQKLRDYCAANNIQLLEIDGRKYKGQNLKRMVREYFKKVNKEYQNE